MLAQTQTGCLAEEDRWAAQQVDAPRQLPSGLLLWTATSHSAWRRAGGRPRRATSATGCLARPLPGKFGGMSVEIVRRAEARRFATWWVSQKRACSPRSLYVFFSVCLSLCAVLPCGLINICLARCHACRLNLHTMVDAHITVTRSINPRQQPTHEWAQRQQQQVLQHACARLHRPASYGWAAISHTTPLSFGLPSCWPPTA